MLDYQLTYPNKTLILWECQLFCYQRSGFLSLALVQIWKKTYSGEEWGFTECIPFLRIAFQKVGQAVCYYKFLRHRQTQTEDTENGWAARDPSGILSPFHFSRRHEIVGLVTAVGSSVHKFKVGDRVGVGVIVGSCQACDICEQSLENYCPKVIFTNNSTDHDGTNTYGGYSDMIVVHQRFVLQFPHNLPSDAGAPLLCAGITVYSPMKYYGMTEPGKHLGVAGLGGLGHIAVKIGKAFGLKVTVISTSPKKEDEAIAKLGADTFVLSSDPAKLKAAANTMDYIIDTIAAVHPLAPLLNLLKMDGKLITVGLPEKPLELPIFPLVLGRKLVGGSDIGGMKETQEMLDFCAKHNITADIELISVDNINTAMERLAKSDVKYRFVIDIANSLSPPDCSM